MFVASDTLYGSSSIHLSNESSLMLSMRSEMMADRKRLSQCTLASLDVAHPRIKKLDHPLSLLGSIEDQIRGHSEPYFGQLI